MSCILRVQCRIIRAPLRRVCVLRLYAVCSRYLLKIGEDNLSNIKIYSQLVALTKEVKLREPKDGYWAQVSFLSGHNGLGVFGGGLSITW